MPKKQEDIIVCTDGKIRFLIYHAEEKKVIATHFLCIIRATAADKQQYLQLYFGTHLGEENFNLQAKMLSVGSTIHHLSSSNLSSFVIPDIQTLKTAAKMQESNNLINKVWLNFIV